MGYPYKGQTIELSDMHFHHFWNHIQKIVFICLVCCSFSSGQSPFYDILGGKNKVTIPFEYRQNFIIVDVLLNNQIPLKFIFDTGAGHTILFEKLYIDLLNIDCTDSIQILGADLSKSITANICRQVKLRFGKDVLATRDIIVLQQDYMFLQNYIGVDVHGIIGTNLFKNFVVRIDYRNRQIEIINPENFKAPSSKKYQKLAIDFIDNKPYVNIPIEINSGKTINAHLLMDSGAGINMILYNGSHPGIQLPQKHLNGTLGAGMGGLLEGYLARIHRVEVAKFDFIQPIIHFQNIDSSYRFHYRENGISNGLLGNQFLSQFTIIIDWWHKTAYFKSRPRAKSKFKYDKSGLYLFAVGPRLNEYIVQDVIEGSPSDLSGIKKGDIIKQINYWPASFYNLDEITRKFQGKTGKKIRLKITRNGTEMIKYFKLKDLI